MHSCSWWTGALWTFGPLRCPSSVLAIVFAFTALAAGPAVSREGGGVRIQGSSPASEIAIYVGEGDIPPVLGSLHTDANGMLFTPRYEIPASVAIRVVIAGKQFVLPAEPRTGSRTATVERVYPSGDEIPANQLKFYIHFSEPMRVGEAWKHVRLLDENQRPVELAFLEMEPELWDAEGRRLTVLFDPGRIKRGVLPRDEVGGALVEGRRYTLVADAAWPSRNGDGLRTTFRKTFRVVAEDRTPIKTAAWQVVNPHANTREPLIIEFGEPLDAALAARLITVPGTDGEIALGPAERSWRITPAEPWKAGPHEIEVDTALEDLAGNRLDRPFDFDTFETVTTRTSRGVVRVAFQVR